LDKRQYKEKVISYILKIFHQIMSHFIILIIKKNVFEKLGIVLKKLCGIIIIPSGPFCFYFHAFLFFMHMTECHYPHVTICYIRG